MSIYEHFRLPKNATFLYKRCIPLIFNKKGKTIGKDLDDIEEGEIPRSSTSLDPDLWMTYEEIQKLLKTAYSRSKKNNAGKRLEIFIYIGLYAGLRISEAINLMGKDIQFSGSAYPYVFVRKGKGNKSRKVPLLNNLKKILLEYRKNKENWGEEWDDGYLLHSPKGKGKYSRSGLFRGFKQILALTNGIERIERFHPHSLRHTYAVHTYKMTRDIVHLMEVLGHEDINATLRYVRAVKKQENMARMDRMYSKTANFKRNYLDEDMTELLLNPKERPSKKGE